jgi:hypothetical protein
MPIIGRDTAGLSSVLRDPGGRTANNVRKPKGEQDHVSLTAVPLTLTISMPLLAPSTS